MPNTPRGVHSPQFSSLDGSHATGSCHPLHQHSRQPAEYTAEPHAHKYGKEDKDARNWRTHKARSHRSSPFPMPTTTTSSVRSETTRRSSATTQNGDRWLTLTDNKPQFEIGLDMWNSHTQGENTEGGCPEELRGGGGGGEREKHDGGQESLVETLERDLTRLMTPAAVLAQLTPDSPTESESPRLHIQIMQEQDLAGISNIRPLMDPVEAFLEESSDDEPDAARLQEERMTLRKSRVKLVKLRSLLRLKQGELRKKEMAKVSADQSFMKFVRQNIAKPLMLSEDPLQNSQTLRQDLDRYFQEMQKARDEYGPLEDEYDRLLGSFGDLEYELERMEGRAYNRKAPKPVNLETSSSPEGSLSDINSVLGLSLSDQKPYAPLHLEYLSRLGDLDLAVEKLAHMNEESDALRSDQETMTRFGLEFDKNLETFLNGLPSELAILEKDITKIQTDVDHLRDQCLKAGIDLEAAENESPIDNSASQTPDIDSAIDGKSLFRETQWPHIENRHGSHCMFIPPFQIPDAEKTNPLQDLITKFDENNKSDRINRWLLYTLQTSKFDACRFGPYFVGLLNLSKFQNNTTRWQLILSTWYTDDANKSPGAFKQGRTQSSNTISALSLGRQKTP